MSRTALLSTALALLLTSAGASAEDTYSPKTYTTSSAYADVRQEIEDGVLDAGLKVDYVGNIGEMLRRTGADIGSTAEVYKEAEFFQFCSARLSRAAMEADPANLGVCPYVIFMYESAQKPGEVVVGYRRPIGAAGEASQKALADIDNLLDGIVKAAVE